MSSNGGQINNLTGDGFLAHFAFDENLNDHAIRALNCAIGIRAAVEALNYDRHYARASTISVGVGIHSGEVAGGYVGLTGMKPFLLIGDTINVTARIENLTKEFSVDVLFSEATHSLIKGRFKSMIMANRKVKGVSKKLTTYWLTPGSKPYPIGKE
ncbi:MAG: adenylate/guanylate cyclase domain-containing protein [Cryobacterium sp.]|nr:adenylate/guanylate cyclase domain-containing protein [Oligoflexia bacterium]